MEQTILEVYKGNSTLNINKSTFKALQERSLLNADYTITDSGLLYVISKLPLTKQCSELRLELKNINLSYEGKVETALLNYYQSLGYYGSSLEGIGISTVLKALMLDKLAIYNAFEDRVDACSRYLEAQFTILENKVDEIIMSIPSVSKNKYLNNFKEIINNAYIASCYPELSIDFANAMYDAINSEIFIKVAKKMAENPYLYRKGWPDLTLVKGNEVLFIEVKTNDKLHESQLITIPAMREVLPYNFSVCKVTRI